MAYVSSGKITGNVVAKQENSTQTADRMEVYLDDKGERVARIVSLASDVLEDEDKAKIWLKRRQIGLGGKAPLTLLTSDAGTAEVEQLLLRIEHNVYT